MFSAGIVFVSNEGKNLNKGVEDDTCDVDELFLNYQNKITNKKYIKLSVEHLDHSKIQYII